MGAPAAPRGLFSAMRSLLSLVAPPLCAICAAPASERAALCRGCDQALGCAPGLHLTVSNADAAWAAHLYEDAARELITALKFSSRLRLANTAAEAIATTIPPHLLLGAVVPVPPSPHRMLWRGFDPAGEIAAALARRTGLRLRPCLRRRSSRRQVGRPRSERLAKPPHIWVRGRPPAAALLVDDVLTTGATLGACAAALRAAGSSSVVAIAFATAPLGK